MSATTLRYDRILAKRNHKTCCEMSGLPIEKGDRYFIGVFAEDGMCGSIKAHSVLQDMAHESMEITNEDSWDPTCGSEYLYEWLQRQLGRTEEAKTCCQAALDYWYQQAGLANKPPWEITQDDITQLQRLSPWTGGQLALFE